MKPEERKKPHRATSGIVAVIAVYLVKMGLDKL